MSEQNQQPAEQQPASAADGATPAAGTPAAEGEKTFVPFFNEEYEFRLGAIFVFMLVAAALMYMGAWWWVGTHPLAHR